MSSEEDRYSPEGSEIDSLPHDERIKSIKRLKHQQITRYLELEQEELKKSTQNFKSTQSRHRNIKLDSCHVLFDAINSFDETLVKRLIVEEGVDVNLQKAGTGTTLLHQCCIDDNISSARLLLAQFASPNIQDSDLWSPLHVASFLGRRELIQLLIQFDAAPELLDVDGNLAIDYANGEIKQLLLAYMQTKGYDENKMIAIRTGTRKQMHTDVQAMIEQCQDLDRYNSRGVTLLHVASANGYYESAKLLVRNNAKVNIQDDRGNTPLHCASKYNHSKVTKLLLNNNANPLMKNFDSDLATDLAEEDSLRELLQDSCLAFSVSSSGVVHSSLPLFSSEQSDAELQGDSEQFANSLHVSKMVIGTRMSYSKREELFEYETMSDKESFLTNENESERSQAACDRVVARKSMARAVKQKPQLPEQCGSDDLATLSNMSENIVLEELRQRYAKDQIYTYVGDILIAINPFKLLPYYSPKVSREYFQIQSRQSIPPHIFAVADLVFQEMKEQKHAQCCVISGESGAGKTETSKFLVQHLLSNTPCLESSLNVKIQQASPLLEAFGNAVTVMNDNSSRFGKYFEIIFNGEGAVTGAFFREYLLEKSRIVYQPKRERNFHIFYMMYAGLTAEEKSRFKLSDPSQHRSLTANGMRLDGAFDETRRAEFQEVRDCLQAIGFTKEDESSLLNALAAVLHLCDISFEPEGTNKAAKVTNTCVLGTACSLLGVDSSELGTSLIEDTHVIHGEQTIRQRNVLQAQDCRDALAKALYQRMFGWIVNSINHLLSPLQQLENNPIKIGILDIFGFENFERNGFEQMCINLANEQLQYYFNEHVFEYEKSECQKEGVNTAAIKYTSNRPILDLFLEKHKGILAQIDEESKFNTSTDKSLALSLHQGHEKNTRDIYIAPRDQGPTFSVVHYAGIVKYNINGFLEKNRDTLAQALQMTMRTSSNLLLRDMFGSKLTRTGSVQPSLRQKSMRKGGEQSPFAFFKKRLSKEIRASKHQKKLKAPDTRTRGPNTVAFHFRNSLQELMDKMSQGTPHFIRCIKPNIRKEPDAFNPDFILQQLRYTGVMETTRIRRQGYATRLTFSEFIKRYPALRATYLPVKSGAPHSGEARTILNKLQLRDWEIGKTKIFLKYYHTEQLAQQEENVLKKYLICQKTIRGFIARCKYARLCDQKVRQMVVVRVFLETIPNQLRDVSTTLESFCAVDVEKEVLRLEEEKRLCEEEEKRIREEEEEKRLCEEEKKRIHEEEEEKRLREEEEEKRLREEEKEKRLREEEEEKRLREEEKEKRLREEEKKEERERSAKTEKETKGEKLETMENEEKNPCQSISRTLSYAEKEVIQTLQQKIFAQQKLLQQLLNQTAGIPSSIDTVAINESTENQSTAAQLQEIQGKIEELRHDKVGESMDDIELSTEPQEPELSDTDKMLLEIEIKIKEIDNFPPHPELSQPEPASVPTTELVQLDQETCELADQLTELERQEALATGNSISTPETFHTDPPLPPVRTTPLLDNSTLSFAREDSRLQALDQKLNLLQEKEEQLKQLDSAEFLLELPELGKNMTQVKIKRTQRSIKIKRDLKAVRDEHQRSFLEKQYQEVKAEQAMRRQRNREQQRKIQENQNTLQQRSRQVNDTELAKEANFLKKKGELIEKRREISKRQEDGEDIGHVQTILSQKDHILTQLLSQLEQEKRKRLQQEQIELSQINKEKEQLHEALREEQVVRLQEEKLLEKIERLKELEEEDRKVRQAEEHELMRQLTTPPGLLAAISPEQNEPTDLEKQLQVLEQQEKMLIETAPSVLNKKKDQMKSVEQRIILLEQKEKDLIRQLEGKAARENEEAKRVLEKEKLLQRQEQLLKKKEMEDEMKSQQEELKKQAREMEEMQQRLAVMEEEASSKKKEMMEREVLSKQKETEVIQREEAVLVKEDEVKKLEAQSIQKEQALKENEQLVKEITDKLEEEKETKQGEEERRYKELESREISLKEMQEKLREQEDYLKTKTSELTSTLPHIDSISLPYYSQAQTSTLPARYIQAASNIRPPSLEQVIQPPPPSRNSHLPPAPDSTPISPYHSTPPPVNSEPMVPPPASLNVTPPPPLSTFPIAPPPSNSPMMVFPLFEEHIPRPPPDMSEVISQSHVFRAKRDSAGYIPPSNHPFNPVGIVMDATGTTIVSDTAPLVDSRIPPPPPNFPSVTGDPSGPSLPRTAGGITKELLTAHSKLRNAEQNSATSRKPKNSPQSDLMAAIALGIRLKSSPGPQIRGEETHQKSFRHHRVLESGRDSVVIDSHASLDPSSLPRSGSLSDLISPNTNNKMIKECKLVSLSSNEQTPNKARKPNLSKSIDALNETHVKDSTPDWMRELKEKKNKELAKEHSAANAQKQAELAEQEKIANMPPWKRELILKKRGINPQN